MKQDTRHNGKSGGVAAVVVGVDGSEGAKGALRWALEEGRLRKWPVRAVHAWMFGYSGGSVAGYPYWGGSPGSVASLGVDLSDLQRAAEDLLERAIAEVADADDAQIERQVLEGAAAEVLVRIATPSDLLVVGSRGHGGFASLLLGSVSQQCIHHAACPVLVVRPPTLRPRDDRVAGALQAESPATV